MPDFRLTNIDNQPIALAALRGARGLVLAFIHGTWCPYCIRQLKRLNAATPDLLAQGVGVACVTHDPLATVAAYQQTAQPPLRFTLLADSEPSLAHAYNVFDPDHRAPYPAVIYGDAAGIVQYSDLSTDPDCFPNMERLREVVAYGPKGAPPEA
jgi:peroxiredoxin